MRGAFPGLQHCAGLGLAPGCRYEHLAHLTGHAERTSEEKGGVLAGSPVDSSL
jgi:hypothetical protein